MHIRSSKFLFHAFYLSSTGLFHLKRFFSYSVSVCLFAIFVFDFVLKCHQLLIQNLEERVVTQWLVDSHITSFRIYRSTDGSYCRSGHKRLDRNK